MIVVGLMNVCKHLHLHLYSHGGTFIMNIKLYKLSLWKAIYFPGNVYVLQQQN